MKVKRQKRHRRAVKFYAACFGFREPYKVLCDGTFISHLLVHDLLPADKCLSSLLGGPSKLFASHCIVAELNSLGDAHADATRAARELPLARCEHLGRRKSAVSCIQEIVGGDNSEHFFVATQDAELRSNFREIPAVPLIYGLRKSLFLEPPSTKDRQFAKTTEDKQSHISERELQILYKGKENKIDSQGATYSSDIEEPRKQSYRNLKTKRKVLGVVDKVKFKRKRAKGPNPLSCKKKKNKESISLSDKGGNAGEGSKRKRKRSRKKHPNTKSKGFTQMESLKQLKETYDRDKRKGSRA